MLESLIEALTCKIRYSHYSVSYVALVKDIIRIVFVNLAILMWRERLKCIHPLKCCISFWGKVMRGIEVGIERMPWNR